MGKYPAARTVHLVDGPACGHEVEARYAWLSVAIVDGEVITYDPDGDVQLIWAALDKVKGAWLEYHQGDDSEHPELYYFVEPPPPWPDTGTALPVWQGLPGAFGAGVEADHDRPIPPGGPGEG